MNLRKKQIFGLTGSLLLGLVASLNVNASVIDGTVTGGADAFVLLTDLAPISAVGNNNFNENNLYAFDEDQGTTIGAGGVEVDYLVSNGLSGTLAEGTIVDSHYVFYDPAQGNRATGTVEFDADILAIIYGSANLYASDDLGVDSIDYSSHATLRGIQGSDEAIVLGSRELYVSLAADDPGDYVRVLTAGNGAGGPIISAQVPVPATLPLMLLGLIGIRGLIKRNR